MAKLPPPSPQVNSLCVFLDSTLVSIISLHQHISTYVTSIVSPHLSHQPALVTSCINYCSSLLWSSSISWSLQPPPRTHLPWPLTPSKRSINNHLCSSPASFSNSPIPLLHAPHYTFSPLILNGVYSSVELPPKSPLWYAFKSHLKAHFVIEPLIFF